MSFSCTHDPTATVDQDMESQIDSCYPDLINFVDVVQPIIATNCAIEEACHSGDNSWGNFTTYSGIVEKIETGAFVSRVAGGTMPPDYTDGPYPLDTCSRQILLLWIEQGFPL